MQGDGTALLEAEAYDLVVAKELESRKVFIFSDERITLGPKRAAQKPETRTLGPRFDGGHRFTAVPRE
jgi:hypothetical protein